MSFLNWHTCVINAITQLVSVFVFISFTSICMHEHLHVSIKYPNGLYGIPWVSPHLRPTGGPSSAHIGDLNEQAMLILWIESFGKGRRPLNINCTKTCRFRCITTYIWRILRRHTGSWLFFWLVRMSSISGAECSFKYLNNLEPLWFSIWIGRCPGGRQSRESVQREPFEAVGAGIGRGTAGHGAMSQPCVFSVPPVTLPASMKSSRPLGHQNKSSWRCHLNSSKRCKWWEPAFSESEGNVTFQWN